MKHILVRDVTEALREGVWHMNICGMTENSRNGRVIVSPGPVLTEYRRPFNRVLQDPVRDANPVFHLMEALWMLAGQDNVEWLLQFNSKFGQYAEEDGTVHGAYGYRWFQHFAMDQVLAIIQELQRDPQSRRAVLAMWDPRADLGADKRDLPCNTHIYFDLRMGLLNMTVCCRSNDMVYGAYGANAVHMSILQEVMASALNVSIGVYRQFSNNFHVYPDVPVAKALMTGWPGIYDSSPYVWGAVQTMRLIAENETMDEFLEDCHTLVHGLSNPINTTFFQTVAVPLRDLYIKRQPGQIISIPPGMEHNDWWVAFLQWTIRRAK